MDESNLDRGGRSGHNMPAASSRLEAVDESTAPHVHCTFVAKCSTYEYLHLGRLYAVMCIQSPLIGCDAGAPMLSGARVYVFPTELLITTLRAFRRVD